MSFSITEETDEHESLAFTSNFQTSEEVSVTLHLLKQSVDVASVQQHVKGNQSIQLQAMELVVNTSTLEGKKVFSVGQRCWIRE